MFPKTTCSFLGGALRAMVPWCHSGAINYWFYKRFVYTAGALLASSLGHPEAGPWARFALRNNTSTWTVFQLDGLSLGRVTDIFKALFMICS